MDLFVNIIAHILVVALPGIIFLCLLLCFIDDLKCNVMIEGEIYPIYINPHMPKNFLCAKKRHLIFNGAILTFMGLITLAGIIELIKKLLNGFEIHI